MLTFNLKKEWFEKIKSGEKTHEYRECKPYWQKRIIAKNGLFLHINNSYFSTVNKGKFVDNLNIDCVFVCGYASKNDKEKRLKGTIKTICLKNGKETDLKINKPVYDIEFELIDSKIDKIINFSQELDLYTSQDDR